MQISRKKLCT